MTSSRPGDSGGQDRGAAPARCWALVPCAGVGARAGTAGPKQYAPVAGRPLVAWTLDALARVPELSGILVVLAPDDDAFETQAGRVVEAIAARLDGRLQFEAERVGGDTRAHSVSNGLESLLAHGAREDDWVLVHDAARCLVHPESISRLIASCRDDDVGGLLALPVPDTLKRSSGDGAGEARVAATVPRAGMWAAQTPQMFRLGLLREALRRGLARPDLAITDEASAVEALGLHPRLVRGDYENLKITWPEDFALAERLQPMTVPFRIGEGWDTHQLVADRPLILGGVTIPHTHGLLGHSDADALSHAITDALLGAAGLGDIGRHFPDTDDAFRGANSIALLREACARVRLEGWVPVNVDATIVAQAPRMAAHIPAMRERIAQALGLAVADVNVKAKTAEKMGPVGEGRAMEARAVCLLARRQP